MSLFKNKPVSEPIDAAKTAAGKPSQVNSRQKTGPTPSRKTQEAKHYQGIVGGDKKAAKARAREESRRRMELEQEGLRTGREDLLPVMHRGAARRAVRDYVDSRYTFSEWMIVLILILMFGGLIAVSIINQNNEALALKINTWSMILSYVFLIGGCLEGAFFASRARKHAIEKLGEEKIPRGLRWYAFSRLVMPRRFRQPRPQVTRSLRGKPQE
ncbi:MAG: DUF3043 domain-containing protein [Mobiluncus porci]|uniref:DUF3043 domain-containing protein n=1 Tax=Mobiluncus porci TaxID=2652278 RepID=A0A7K0K006_9ACTO|nr:MULTISPECIES: DUF3043 domain-containing protein [Mobiluncus]MCI6585316.1 DUF3043 domain-containing protein [Mobiluncus sp.]MDD7541475.1 DUF3043 domain-containing protein [Mobiluncus porci]MDY5748460.1 DUF3043 domain-containing protein [Mobiluncus porci]MST48783.1 DUF3043 domain-containing protein [Mobiluncus porci]